MNYRVGMVEDDPLIRSLISDALSRRDDIDMVSISSSGPDLVALAKTRGVDVALLDVHLGSGPSGFDIAQALRRASPGIGIVFLSSVKDPRLLGYAPATLPKGARYVLKSELSDVSRLAETIIDTANDSFHADEELPSIPFTHTQIEILRLVASGYSNQAIATERVVTERAVEAAITRLADHLGLKETPGVNQRVHIAAMFFRQMGWSP